jgi:peptidoglycan hydrolase-like protein with peptidoglycan-binding domain
MTSKKLTTLAQGLGLFAIITAVPFLASAATLSVQLDPGMSGADVSALQTFLAKDSTIYPEGLVTGFFGSLTEAAVKRYQTEFGISAVGRVGPATLASINGNSGTGGSDDVSAPITTSINISAGSNSAVVAWTSNEQVFGRVMYGTGSQFVYASSPSASGQSGFNTLQTVTLNGLLSHTTYYYVLESTDVAGNLTWTIDRSFMTK